MGIPIPSHASLSDHTQGANTKGDRRHGCPSLGRGCMELHPPTHTHTDRPPPHQGLAGLQRSRALWGQWVGKQQSLLIDRWLAHPHSLPALSPKSLSAPRPLLCLAILLWPLASSLLLETERKRVQSRELTSILQSLSLMPSGLSPAPSGKGSGQALSWPLFGRSRRTPGLWAASQRHTLSGHCRAPTCLPS